VEPLPKRTDAGAAAPAPEARLSHAEPDDISHVGISLVDAAVGACSLALGTATAVACGMRALLAPVAHAVLNPPAPLPPQLHPRHWLGSLGRRGAEARASSRQGIAQLLDALVPVVLEELLRRTDLTDTVVRHVNLTEVVAAVDLDAAAARLDVNAIAGRLDLDAVAGRLDVDAVARRIDIDAVLDRLDLTAVVLTRVDLDALIHAVLERLDLPRLAEEVIDAVDLPEIIRESTGSMASDTIRGVRMQGIAADEAVRRVRGRLLLRRNRGSTGMPDPDIPQTQAPETQAPETQAPETQAPETQAPERPSPGEPERPLDLPPQKGLRPPG
jgi:hypothetical protein